MSNDKMRSEFETELSQGFWCAHVFSFIRTHNGDYLELTTQLCWLVWQAVLESKPEVIQPVVLKVIRGEVCYKSKSDDQSFGMWCPINPAYDHGLLEGTQFFTSPPDYEALKWKYEGALENIRYHAKLGHVLLAENKECYKTILLLTEDLQYIAGIAEKHSGFKTSDNLKVRGVILGCMQNLEFEKDNLKLMVDEYERVYLKDKIQIQTLEQSVSDLEKLYNAQRECTDEWADKVDALKLRVVELEEDLDKAHTLWNRVLTKGELLLIERDKLRDAAKQALLALHFHTEQTRPIDTSIHAMDTLNAALKEQE